MEKSLFLAKEVHVFAFKLIFFSFFHVMGKKSRGNCMPLDAMYVIQPMNVIHIDIYF